MSTYAQRRAGGSTRVRAGTKAIIASWAVCTAALAGPPGSTSNSSRSDEELTPQAMESLSDVNPIDLGGDFLTGARPDGMNEAQYCSNLGDNPLPERRDRDNFTFDGTAGEEVVVQLAAQGANHRGTHATLALSDQIRNVQFFRVDRSALPNAVRGKLPATGRYVIVIEEQTGIVRESAFTGDYCLTFRSSGGAAGSLLPTDSVEGAKNLPPHADAGPDQSVTDSNGDGVESVPLDGSKSNDPDGQIVVFAWSENGGKIAEGAQPRVSFTVGRHDVTLTVTDNDGATHSDNVLITVEENTAQCAVDEDCPDDQNACTDTYCTNGQCENVAIDQVECNDGNECTEDRCDTANGCQHSDNSLTCDDGDACTNNDRCAGGACRGAPIACNDGLFCNGSESCQNGQCVTTGGPCGPAQVCDEATDGCVQCLVGSDCDDHDVCTSDSCLNFQCRNSPVTGCCQTNGDCDDGSLCTIDACTNNACTHSARNCSDGNACTVDSCSTQTGCVHTTVSCDDGNACTDDSCSTATGCAHAANTAVCDDNDFCTIGDRCAAGVCGGPSVDCDDGLFCTGVETCLDGDCASSGNPCADGEFCDEVNGCNGAPRGSNRRGGTTPTTASRPTMSSQVTAPSGRAGTGNHGGGSAANPSTATGGKKKK